MLLAPRFGEQTVCLFQLLEVRKGAELATYVVRSVVELLRRAAVVRACRYNHGTPVVHA